MTKATMYKPAPKSAATKAMEARGDEAAKDAKPLAQLMREDAEAAAARDAKANGKAPPTASADVARYEENADGKFDIWARGQFVFEVETEERAKVEIDKMNKKGRKTTRGARVAKTPQPNPETTDKFNDTVINLVMQNASDVFQTMNPGGKQCLGILRCLEANDGEMTQKQMIDQLVPKYVDTVQHGYRIYTFYRAELIKTKFIETHAPEPKAKEAKKAPAKKPAAKKAPAKKTKAKA